MPRPSKRSRKTTQLESQHDLEAPPNPPDARPTNTSGFPIFPDELLLEILSYYPALPLPTVEFSLDDIDASIARREVLHALSQTCRTLRRFFRAYVWERIEVCSGMVLDGSRVARGAPRRNRELNLELVRQLEVVSVRDESLAGYVKVVNVEIADYSIESVLVELARCMALFPNLHTVKLSIAFDHKAPKDAHARKAFKGHAYPHIKHLLLDEPVFPLMLSCSQVLDVRCLKTSSSRYWSGGPTFLQCAAKCSLLQELPIGFGINNDSVPEFHNFPNLRVVSCSTEPPRFYMQGNGIADGFFSSLASLTHLQTIHVRVLHTWGGMTCEDILKRLKDILQKVQARDGEEKTIVALTIIEVPWRVLEEKVIRLPVAVSKPVPLRTDREGLEDS